MAAKPKAAMRSTDEAKSERGVSYDEFKEYEGQRYTGMKIGRTHKWYYDRGEWTETKITPDLWQISYAVSKRRAGRAPEGSGVPVGTAYHWYVLAHQNVAKQTANDYTTSLTGLKFKIAHKRAGGDKWSATPRTQRKRMIMFLQSVIADLEKQDNRADDVASQRDQRTLASRRKAMASPDVKQATQRRRSSRQRQPAAQGRRATRM